MSDDAPEAGLDEPVAPATIVVRARPDDVERIDAAVGDVLRVRGDEAALRGATIVVVGLERQREVFSRLEAEPRPIVLVGDTVDADAAPPVLHAIRRDLPPPELRALLVSLATGGPRFATPPPSPETPADARRVQRAFAASRRLAAAHELAACEQHLVDAVVELTGADRAACLFHDGEDGSIWSEARRATPTGDERRAVAGLVGYAARTGAAAAALRAADDPRWAAALDDPGGDEHARLLAQPILGRGGQVHAVLVAARGGRRPGFGAEEASALASLAGFAAPFLDQLSTHIEAQAVLEADDEDALFRREAIEAQALPRWGDVVRVAPGWIGWAYWLLVALLVASLVYVSVGTIATYSSGPAIIRAASRADVTARTAGNVTAIAVAPGDAVTPGQVIARLDDADERGAVDRLERELETQLRNHMLDPADAAADASLRGLRLELERARVSLEDRVVRAPAAGVVADVRVRPGQRLEPGDLVASVADASGGLEVIGLLPGSDRPQLAPGMALRLELAGYRYTYQALRIDRVSTDVVSPTEALRILGPEVAGGLRLGGPVVLVRAHLPTDEFEVDGRRYRYHDGMLGLAEVRVREERIVYTLVPGLRRL